MVLTWEAKVIADADTETNWKHKFTPDSGDLIISIDIKCRMKLLFHSQTSNGGTIEVWEWISNFIPHFTKHVITYPCRYKLIHASKTVPTLSRHNKRKLEMLTSEVTRVTICYEWMTLIPFVPCQPAIPFLRSGYLKLWPWNVKVMWYGRTVGPASY